MNNLPIPQSRSEELMNAFIQRDSSQISAPQSRIEEFWYHLIEGTNSLPIPQSRNELLLKKIIENDTHQIPLAQSRTEEFLVSILTGDINKLPIPQSRSEYYLDYIARNNLLLNDIDYVRYSGTNITATNTVQKPFRSAILKGNTLINLAQPSLRAWTMNLNSDTASLKVTTEEFIIDWSKGVSSNAWILARNDNSPVFGNMLKADTDYTFIIRILENNPTFEGVAITGDVAYFQMWGLKGYQSEVSALQAGVIGTIALKYNFNRLSTTQNLENIFGIFVRNNSSDGTKTIDGGKLRISKDIIILEGDYTNNYQDFACFEGMESVRMPVLTTSNGDGTKTNILSCNEEVILRGIGDVKDTLDGNTGELTQRIGEVVLSSDLLKTVEVRTRNGGSFIVGKLSEIGFKNTKDIISNLRKVAYYGSEAFQIGDMADVNGGLGICFSTDGVNNTKEQGLLYLDSIRPKVYGVLTTPTIKTVDLKVVNQDGNQVKELSAFDGTTHIVSGSASDNSLIAITEVEVPTKLIEVLDGVKSLSSDVEILINEVDNTQKLQDENSTMAMSAMTELYEMILMMGGND